VVCGLFVVGCVCVCIVEYCCVLCEEEVVVLAIDVAQCATSNGVNLKRERQNESRVSMENKAR